MKTAYSGAILWLTALFVLASSTAAIAQRYDHGWCMMGPWFGGVIMWIIIILLAALLVYLFIRSTNRPPAPYETGGETPLDIAKKRYARGEISKAEFDEMKKDLSS